MRIFFIRFSELGGTFEPKPQRCWVSNKLENLVKYDSQRSVISDPLQLLNTFSLKG